MIRFSLAYRWPNGEIEGFRRTRFSEETARNACVAAIKDKASGIGVTFDESRLVLSGVGLTDAEVNQVIKDWQTDAGK